MREPIDTRTTGATLGFQSCQQGLTWPGMDPGPRALTFFGREPQTIDERARRGGCSIRKGRWMGRARTPSWSRVLPPRARTGDPEDSASIEESGGAGLL